MDKKMELRHLRNALSMALFVATDIYGVHHELVNAIRTQYNTVCNEIYKMVLEEEV